MQGNDGQSTLLADAIIQTQASNPLVKAGKQPGKDFVLCWDSEGTPTATYGQDTWDLNPLALSAKLIANVRFDRIFKGKISEEQRKLIEEVRFILFCLMYYASACTKGSIDASTILSYSYTLRQAARYCESLRENSLVGQISIQRLLTTQAYLNGFLKSLTGQTKHQSQTLIIMTRLFTIGEANLGYQVLSSIDFNGIPERDRKQHPVIPSRLYIDLINLQTSELNLIEPYIPKLESFISCFEDRLYGINLTSQLKINKSSSLVCRPDFAEAVTHHGLEGFFTGDYSCTERRSLSLVITRLQYLLKNVLHTYTGMRDQEVVRLPYDCLANEEAYPAQNNAIGEQIKPSVMIDIISTTTKLTRVRKEEVWLAPLEAKRAIVIAQAICRGIARVLGVPAEKLPLFTSSAAIRRIGIKPRATVFCSDARPFYFKKLTITESDLSELLLTDEKRDFMREADFFVGSIWPLCSHQLRRSLAFYASSSGFVSMPSIASQFKHLAIQMARYYANNFDKIKTIFGYYDKDAGEYKLPQGHFLHEFQIAVPMHIAHDLIAAVLSDIKFSGGGGTQIIKQRELMQAGEISIVEFRSSTVKRVASGELSYRNTFLGGCMKKGHCDSYMLGQNITCLKCDGAAIHPEKLNNGIRLGKEELSLYAKNSGEYQVVKLEISELEAYRSKWLKVAEEE